MKANKMHPTRPTKGGRPHKIDDYIVHRIAELIHLADAIHEDKKVQSAMAQGGIKVEMANGKFVTIDGPIEDAVDEIASTVGHFICGDVRGKHLKREHRERILRQICNVLAKKPRKSPDDIAKIRAAWLEAKAALKGPYRDNPTYGEVDQEYYNRTGWHLDRRALAKVKDCPVRPDTRGVKKNCHGPTD